jgi:hypothetical protein
VNCELQKAVPYNYAQANRVKAALGRVRPAKKKERKIDS